MRKRTVFYGFLVIVCILVLSSTVDAARRLPDLTITKISVNKNCHLAIKVRNNGPGKLPNHVYTKHHSKSAGVYIFVNGKKWGGRSIWKFDPGKNLKKPGGSAVYVSKYKVSAAVSVRAVVDKWNNVKEANESNNKKFIQRLTCGASTQNLPDLTVRNINSTRTGKIKVTIANIGSAGVPSSYYELPNAVAIQMYKGSQAWGGLILKGVDPLGELKNPGGVVRHIWFPNAANLDLGYGQHTIKVIVDVHQKLAESNENNNVMIKRLSKLMKITDVHQYHAGECYPEIDIHGSGFGNNSTNKVIHFGTQATVQQFGAWAPSEINIGFPTGLVGGQTYPVKIVDSITNNVISNIYSFVLKYWFDAATPWPGTAGDTITLDSFLLPVTQGNNVLMLGNTVINNITLWQVNMNCCDGICCQGQIKFVLPSGITAGTYPIYIMRGGKVVSGKFMFTVQ